MAPSTLCGSPVPGESPQVRLSHLLQHRSWMLHRPLRRQGGCELDWLTQKGRGVRGSLPRRARRASGEGLRASELFRIFREELRKFYSDFSVVLF